MFAHSEACPWARRPFALPIACILTATIGVTLAGYAGDGPVMADVSMLSNIMVLRLFDLHVPPALAVGLLPFVIPNPTYEFAMAVGTGTAWLTISFLVWRAVAATRLARIFHW
jgi:hypothetical protein